MKRALSFLALALASACAFRSTPVKLQGDPVAIAWLGGSWDGEYWGASSGRRGTLSFYLPSGTDSLTGDVMMTDVSGVHLTAADPVEQHRLHARSLQLLRVEVVIAYRDSLRGVLEPYTAPDCGCTVTTTFVGHVAGNEITGTFETRGASGVLAVGQWHVTRTGTTPR